MTSSEIVRSALIKSGKTQRALADHMGWSRQNMNIRLRKGTLTFNELDKALEFLGCRIVVGDDEGRPLQHYGNGTTPKLTRSIGGKVYDTSKASLIATTKDSDADSVDEYMELYVDTSGKRFVAFRFQNSRGAISIDPAAIDRFTKSTSDHTASC